MEILRKTAALRVQKQTDGREPDEVRVISLSGVPALAELWSSFKNLSQLTLVCMKPRVASLEQLKLEALPLLRLLDVSDNAVTVSSQLPLLPSLTRLLMPNNQIATMEEVGRVARSCPILEILDLVDNAVDEPERFTAIFDLFPRLVALDSRTRDGSEVIVEGSSESEGSDEEEEEESETSGSTDEEEEEEEISCSNGDAALPATNEPELKKQRTDV